MAAAAASSTATASKAMMTVFFFFNKPGTTCNPAHQLHFTLCPATLLAVFLLRLIFLSFVMQQANGTFFLSLSTATSV